MSSTTGLGSDITSTTSASPSASTSSSGRNSSGNSSNPGSFYRNLFYILIGLLAAFGLVSFLSLMRARRRRHAIIHEANRLGVIVPGIPGYIPLRERRHMGWMKSDGSQRPDWWEVEQVEGDDVAKVATEQEKSSSLGSGRGEEKSRASGREGINARGGGGEDEEFHPLAIIPPRPVQPKPAAVPISTLKYFPNHLSYRPESLYPPKSEFTNFQDPSILNGLVGSSVDLVSVIRMPMPPHPGEIGEEEENGQYGGGSTIRRRRKKGIVEEGEEVIEEWGGVELGIAEISVVASSTEAGAGVGAGSSGAGNSTPAQTWRV
ncbi:hypothetical protein I316_03699 [Kwoniella heveanensis BCC8398]|uniref:Uncharacterized protein n=1 Tax=Kwoniella heveanensis BCC8398 TaxID=1296120 RepID=A0A1B9GUC8_9TREE|nr:hypothetical protein I316_03699 [Kwoniella heveanensis BCC8398]